MVRPGPLDIIGRDHPLELGPSHLRAVYQFGIIGMAVGALLGVGALATRHRSAGAVERAQLKWFVGASEFVILLVALIAFVPKAGHAHPLLGALEFSIVVAGYWALPAAIVTAVLHYRLYDIDR